MALKRSPFFTEETDHHILNLGKLTYAGYLESGTTFSDHPQYEFLRRDICDQNLVLKLFNEFQPDIVMHLAPESHFGCGIDSPADFIQTNTVDTSLLLRCA